MGWKLNNSGIQLPLIADAFFEINFSIFFQGFEGQRSQSLPTNGWHLCLLEGFRQVISPSIEFLTKVKNNKKIFLLRFAVFNSG